MSIRHAMGVLSGAGLAVFLALWYLPPRTNSSSAESPRRESTKEPGVIAGAGQMPAGTQRPRGAVEPALDSDTASSVSLGPPGGMSYIPIDEILREAGKDRLSPTPVERRVRYPIKTRTRIPDDLSPTEYVANRLSGFFSLLKTQPIDKGSGARYRDLQDEIAELAMGNPEVLEALIAAVDRPGSAGSRDVDLVLLGRLPSDRAREFLISVARSHADNSARMVAIQSLGQDGGLNVVHEYLGTVPFFDPQRGPVTDRLVLNELLRLAREDSDPEVRICATRLLARSQGDDAHPAKAPANRIVETIPEFARVTEALSRMASSEPDATVRTVAIDALEYAPPAQWLNEMLAERVATESDSRSRQRAIAIVGEREKGLPVIKDLYIRLADSDDWKSRGNGLALLQYMPEGEERERLALQAALTDPEPQVRDAAQKIARALVKDKRRRVEVMRNLLRQCPPDDEPLRQRLVSDLWQDAFWPGLVPAETSTDSDAARLLADLRSRYPKKTP